MKNKILTFIFFLLCSCSSEKNNEEKSLGLQVGEKVPSLQLLDTEGNSVDLRKFNRPLVLVFFRGSWCPYCISQLKSLNSQVFDKIKAKAQLIAISVDGLAAAKKMKRRFSLEFQIVSDPKAKSLKAFNIVNQLEQSLVDKYKNSYKIDIESDSGETHHMIAHPAVFIVDNNKIVFSDVHTNYKQRTNNQAILKALGI